MSIIIASKCMFNIPRKACEECILLTPSLPPSRKDVASCYSPNLQYYLPPQVTIDGKRLQVNSKPYFLTRPKPKPSVEEGTRALPPSHSLLGVEGYAIEHYMKKKGWPCAIHAENSTFSMLFALLMWDVIFSAVPDVFRAQFQASWRVAKDIRPEFS